MTYDTPEMHDFLVRLYERLRTMSAEKPFSAETAVLGLVESASFVAADSGIPEGQLKEIFDYGLFIYRKIADARLERKKTEDLLS